MLGYKLPARVRNFLLGGLILQNRLYSFSYKNISFLQFSHETHFNESSTISGLTTIFRLEKKLPDRRNLVPVSKKYVVLRDRLTYLRNWD